MRAGRRATGNDFAASAHAHRRRVGAPPQQWPLANPPGAVLSRRRRGARGRFSALLASYRSRTGNGLKQLRTGDLTRFG